MNFLSEEHALLFLAFYIPITTLQSIQYSWFLIPKCNFLPTVHVVWFLKNCFFHQSSTFEVHLVLVLNMLLLSGLLMCLTRNRSTCPELRLVWKKQLLHLWPKTNKKNTVLHLNILNNICSTIDILSILIFEFKLFP